MNAAIDRIVGKMTQEETLEVVKQLLELLPEEMQIQVYEGLRKEIEGE